MTFTQKRKKAWPDIWSFWGFYRFLADFAIFSVFWCFWSDFWVFIDFGPINCQLLFPRNVKRLGQIYGLFGVFIGFWSNLRTFKGFGRVFHGLTRDFMGPSRDLAKFPVFVPVLGVRDLILTEFPTFGENVFLRPWISIFWPFYRFLVIFA